MSEILEAGDASIAPDCFMSSNKYASYLWLGHCIFNPEDYYNDLRNYHQDNVIASDELAKFKSNISSKPEEAILLPLMGRIIHSAHLELGESLPFTGKERRLLQVYLVGEVSVRGQEILEQDGLIDQDPALARIQSPFKDSTLIDKVIRYRRCSRASKSLIEYATMDRLLPGYERAITSEE